MRTSKIDDTSTNQTQTMVDSKSVIKAAKKALKKDDGSSMSLSKLSSATAKKTKEDSHEVEAIIRGSKKFTLDSKNIVSLSKKRGKEESDPKKDPDEIRSPKKAKKGKGKHETSSSALLSSPEVPGWRKEHKIIVLPAEEGGDAKNVQQDARFFPFPSFDSCKPSLGDALISHCTKANNFKSPSPIQAQAWPLLANGEDIVGIAETGSGTCSCIVFSCLTQMQQERR